MHMYKYFSVSAPEEVHARTPAITPATFFRAFSSDPKKKSKKYKLLDGQCPNKILTRKTNHAAYMGQKKA